MDSEVGGDADKCSSDESSSHSTIFPTHKPARAVVKEKGGKMPPPGSFKPADAHLDWEVESIMKVETKQAPVTKHEQKMKRALAAVSD